MRYVYQAILIFIFALSATGNTLSASPKDNPKTPANSDQSPLNIVFTEFPPYTYINKEGVACGYFVSLISELLQQKKIPHSFASNPTPRIYFQLKSGEADIYLGPQWVPDIQEHIRVIAIPESFNIKLFLWRKTGTPNIQSLEGLENHSLAIIHGFGYGGVLQQLDTSNDQLRLVRSSSHGNAFKMLISGRVDYLLNYEKPVNIQLALHPTEKVLKHPILNIPVAFMVSRNIDNSLELFTTLSASVERYFKSLPATGPNNTAVAVDTREACNKQ